MIIRLNEIQESILPAFKGGEKELQANMFFDGKNRLFKGCLIPGASIGIHTHEDSCETKARPTASETLQPTKICSSMLP